MIRTPRGCPDTARALRYRPVTVPTLLRTENLSRSFGQLVAVDGVTLEGPAGELRGGIKAPGCGIIQGIFQVGSLPHDLAMKNMELFTREVVPTLRAEFP